MRVENINLPRKKLGVMRVNLAGPIRFAISRESSSYSPESQKSIMFQWGHMYLYIGLLRGAFLVSTEVMSQATHYSKAYTHRDI